MPLAAIREVIVPPAGVMNDFFFQAEEGIGDLTVTGVQTFALPIYPVARPARRPHRTAAAGARPGAGDRRRPRRHSGVPMRQTAWLLSGVALLTSMRLSAQEINSVPRSASHVAGSSRATWNVGRATVHWGKWLVAGGAVAFTVMGAHEDSSSNHAFGALLS